MLIPIAVLMTLTVAAVSPTAQPATQLPVPAQAQWGQWRGALASGASPAANPPIEWSETTHIRWKVPLPGHGLSSPVVWGDRIFLTTAIPVGDVIAAAIPDPDGAHHNVPPERRHRFVVLALDRHTGKVVWERTVREERPHESVHLTASWASPSPVTDGKRVHVYFGSAGLYTFTVDGEPLWQADLGKMRSLHGHGEGSSPVLAGDLLIVNQDHEGESFVVALEAATGKVRWKTSRDEPTSWSTPLIVEHDGRTQVVIAATQRIRGYDLVDGRLLWQCGGLSQNVVASPVAFDGLVIAGSSYDFRAMLAIRLDRAKGEITGSDAVAWSRDRDTPYVPSPVLHDGTLCFLKHLSGILTCVDARTGRTIHGPRRLGELRNIYASPVVAADRLYVFDRDGTAVVLEFGGDFRELARNRLDEGVSASPAIVGDTLYVRGERHLWAIGASGSANPGTTPVVGQTRDLDASPD